MPVTQATPGVVGAVAELAEHVVGAEEARHSGEVRVGLDQVVAGGVGVFDEQAVVALGQLEAGRGGGVDRGEGLAGVVHGYVAAVGRDAGHRQYAAWRLGGGVVDVLAQVDVDAADGDAGLVVTEGAGQLLQGVGVQRAILQGARNVEVDRATGLYRRGVARAAVVGPGGDVALFGETPVARPGLEHLKACFIEITRCHCCVEGGHVDVFHPVPLIGVDALRGADDDGVLPGASRGALVEQVVGGDAQVAIRRQQAIAVLDVVALDQQVFARHQARRGRVLDRGFKVGLVDGDLTALERVVPAAVLAALPIEAAGGDGLAQLEFSLGVFHIPRTDADIAFAFNRTGKVAEARRHAAIERRETQVALAVDVAVQVAEAVPAQGQIAAAEQQRVRAIADAIAGAEVDVAL